MTSLGFNNNNNNSELNVVSWKGMTFKQITSTIQKNINNSTNIKSFFNAQPLKHYRKNIGETGSSGENIPHNERQSVRITEIMETPGGSTYTTIPICSNNGIEITTDPNIPNSEYEKGVFNAVNALNRVRSSGMIRKRSYNVNSYQYLQNRDKTFSQNQFNYINSGDSNVKPGSSLALLNNNSYQQNGSGQFNVANNTVIYKPNNSKFAQQGGVNSSSHIERIKYDTIQTIAHKYKEIYGTTSNDYKISSTYGGTNGTNNGIAYDKKSTYSPTTNNTTPFTVSR